MGTLLWSNLSLSLLLSFSLSLSIYLSISLYLSLSLSISLYLSLSLYLSVFLYISLSLYISLYLSLSLSVQKLNFFQFYCVSMDVFVLVFIYKIKRIKNSFWEIVIKLIKHYSLLTKNYISNDAYKRPSLFFFKLSAKNLNYALLN